METVPVKCTACPADVEAVTCTINPREAVREYRAGCGHLLSEEEAQTAYRVGIPVGPIPLPEVTGATLIAAERSRQIAEEGHTPENDAELNAAQLAWAAWCLLDHAGAENPTEQAPMVWPLPRDRWPTTTDPVRLMTIAGALIAAEIDRRRAEGETP